MNLFRYFLSFLLYSFLLSNLLFAELPTLSLDKQEEQKKEIEVKVEKKEDNSKKEEFSSNLKKKEENIDKQDNLSTSLKLTIPKELANNQTETIQKVKIDDSTTAKITISTKQEEKKIENEEKEKKNNTTNNSLIDNIANLVKNNNNDEKSKIKEVKISPKIDINNPNKQQVLVIKDGDKNINIILQPEIIGCQKCNENKKQINNIKKINKPSTQNNKKKNEKKKNIVKTNKNIVKSTKKVKKNKNTDKKNEDIQQNNNNKDIYKEIVPIEDWDNQEHKTIRKIYENNELSCIGETCNNLISTNKTKQTNNENLKEIKNEIVNNENVKVVEKETKVIDRPIYVVNRIINVDEDMNLTEEQINNIASDTNGAVTVVNNNGKSKKHISSVDEKFKKHFDIINSNQLSYGEVAFIDDYND